VDCENEKPFLHLYQSNFPFLGRKVTPVIHKTTQPKTWSPTKDIQTLISFSRIPDGILKQADKPSARIVADEW